MLDIDNNFDDLPWLQGLRAQLCALAETGRAHPALLLHGPEGVGRRHLALWIAEAALGWNPANLTADSQSQRDGEYHPDFIALEPLQEVDTESGKVTKQKHVISVDQARELLDFLSLTRHGNRGRVAIIYPAEALSKGAANCLLKTLEEPPAGTLLILITQSLRRLPPTVVSRCQRIRVSAPDTVPALQWLAEQLPGEKLENLLDFCGGAPLRTLSLARQDFMSFARKFIADLGDLERRRASPVRVAAACRDQPDLALQLLDWRLSRRIREIQLSREAASRSAEVLAGYDQLAQIRELRRVIKSGINTELSLAELLFEWYGGVGHLQG